MVENDKTLITMQPNFTIDKANWRDLNQLRVIEKECFGEEAWPLISLIGVLTFPNIIRIKAIVDDLMIGFISGDHDPASGIGWITTVGVLEKYRGKGIGKALLLACEDQLPSKVIQLTVRSGNDPAIEMYLQQGYRKLDTWPRYYASGDDGILMRKDR